jgi:hypothetical protein
VFSRDSLNVMAVAGYPSWKLSEYRRAKLINTKLFKRTFDKF